MKTSVLILVIVLVLAVVTKPSDQDCINQVTDHYGDVAGALLQGTGTGRYLIRVEDHVFFKTVYNRFTGEKIGVGAFGKVFYN